MPLRCATCIRWICVTAYLIFFVTDRGYTVGCSTLCLYGFIAAICCLQLCDSGAKGSVQCGVLYGGCAGASDNGNCWIRAVWGEKKDGLCYFSDLVDGHFYAAHSDPASRVFSVRRLFLAYMYGFGRSYGAATFGAISCFALCLIDLTIVYIYSCATAMQALALCDA